MRNAGSTFLKADEHCVAMVFSHSWSDHLRHVREVFEQLKTANLTVNLGKSEIAQATVKYLGKVIGQGKVLPVSAKVEVILILPVPLTRKELKCFLGMARYYEIRILS